MKAVMLKRPYRSQKIIADRQRKVRDYRRRIEEKKAAREPKASDAIEIPTVLTSLVEETLAGIQPSDGKDSSEGPKKPK